MVELTSTNDWVNLPSTQIFIGEIAVEGGNIRELIGEKFTYKSKIGGEILEISSDKYRSGDSIPIGVLLTGGYCEYKIRLTYDNETVETVGRGYYYIAASIDLKRDHKFVRFILDAFAIPKKWKIKLDEYLKYSAETASELLKEMFKMSYPSVDIDDISQMAALGYWNEERKRYVIECCDFIILWEDYQAVLDIAEQCDIYSKAGLYLSSPSDVGKPDLSPKFNGEWMAWKVRVIERTDKYVKEQKQLFYNAYVRIIKELIRTNRFDTEAFFKQLKLEKVSRKVIRFFKKRLRK
ncbi:MAG: hypothetical protein ACTSPI_10150 [Candidatus Heimdallarchaeaceae archaeon]